MVQKKKLIIDQENEKYKHVSAREWSSNEPLA